MTKTKKQTCPAEPEAIKTLPVLKGLDAMSKAATSRLYAAQCVALEEITKLQEKVKGRDERTVEAAQLAFDCINEDFARAIADVHKAIANAYGWIEKIKN